MRGQVQCGKEFRFYSERSFRSHQWVKLQEGNRIPCFIECTLNALWKTSQREHKAWKVNRKVIPGGQVRQDNGWNQKADVVRKKRNRLEINLEVDLKGFGIGQMRRERKKIQCPDEWACCFTWKSGWIVVPHNELEKNQGKDVCLLRDMLCLRSLGDIYIQAWSTQMGRWIWLRAGVGEMGLTNLRITDNPLIFKSTELDEVT